MKNRTILIFFIVISILVVVEVRAQAIEIPQALTPKSEASNVTQMIEELLLEQVAEQRGVKGMGTNEEKAIHQLAATLANSAAFQSYPVSIPGEKQALKKKIPIRILKEPHARIEWEESNLVKDTKWYDGIICEDYYSWPYEWWIVDISFSPSPPVQISPLSGDPCVITANPFEYEQCPRDTDGDGQGEICYSSTFNSLKDLGIWSITFDGTWVDPEFCWIIDSPPCNYVCMQSAVYPWREPVTIFIYVYNDPPTARITHNPTPAWNQPVTLHAKASDPDGGPLTYRWSVIQKPGASMTSFVNPTSANPMLPFSSDKDIGTWKVQLHVDDNEGERMTFPYQLTVPNVPPHIDITGPISVDATKPIILEVTPTQDVDGGNFEIVWDIVQSPPTSEQQPQNAYARGPNLRLPEDGVTTEKDIGTWIFRATATDNEGDSDVKAVTVDVNNLPPMLSFVGGEDIDVCEIILIDATDSWDPDEGDLTFQWDILQAPVDAPLDAGDGFSTSYIEIQTDESYAGTWIFQLTVTDNEGESVESEEFAVLVDAPPTAVITGPTEPISSFSELVIDGSDSFDPDSPCPDRPDLNYCHETIVGHPAKVSHGIVNYCWLLIDVPPELWDDYPTGRVDEVFEVAADSPTFTLEPGTLETGDWAFELKVRDDEGNEDHTTFAVAVVDPNSPPTAVLNAPARYTTDISGILSQDITLSGFQSYDLDNVFDEEELKPGVGITDYQWSIVEAPTGCTPPALPSGKTAHTVNLYTAGESVEPACQGFWQIRLTVTDDDSPAMTGCAETSVIIGNCPQPLCIDYPTTLNPQFVEFTEDTDIFIYYHLDSALYEDAAFSFSMFSMLEIFHESDLTTPVYTSINPNVLASDKGGYLLFHWDGYTADTFTCPPPGFYTVQITLLDDMLGITTFVVREFNAIWIAVASILDTSDKCIKHSELDRGADQVTINYEITPRIFPNELHWRVRDASKTVIFESTMPPALSGTIEWNGQVGGATIPPGSYTVEIEAFGGVFSLGVSDPHEFMVYKNVPPYQIHVTGFVGDVITVDMSETDLNIFRFESSQVSNNPAFPANHNFPANEFGYVAKIDNWETNLSNSGVFYFVPTAAETSELRLAAEDSQSGVSTCISCVIEVQDGHSTAGQNRVTFGSRRLDIYRQQQRLRYFGFPDRNGNNLTVDGLRRPATNWAIGLFNHAVSDRNFNNNNNFPSRHFDQLGRSFINAINAPQWVELPAGGQGWTNDDGVENHDWGTSWATRVVAQAGAANNAGHLMRTNDLSLRAGGDTLDHRAHEAGMDIDVRLVSTGLWYNINPVVANLNSGSNFWNTTKDALPNDNITSSAQARAGVAVGGNFTANYIGNNGWRIDQTIINLYDHRRTGDAYDIAIQSLAQGGFDRGFDVLIPLRAGYDRTATVEQIAAFSDLSVSRVHYNDPVAIRLLQERPVSFRLTSAETHSHHFHVDVERPPI